MDQLSSEEDVKKYKIKESMIWKKSKHLKEWRERWLVLTDNNLYSFEKKQVYKNPTETMPITAIDKVKIYHMDKVERPFTFRIESKNSFFEISCNTNQQKWSWVSSIERMIDRRSNKVQEDPKITQAVNRATFIARQSFRPMMQPKNENVDVNLQNILGTDKPQTKKKKQLGFSKTCSIKILNEQQPTKVESQAVKQQEKQQVKSQVKTQVTSDPIDQLIKEQKTIDDEPKQSATSRISLINTLFQDILLSEQDYRFFVVFIARLATAQKLPYTNDVVRTCVENQHRRFFSQAFLHVINKQCQEETLNELLKFLILMYEQSDDFLYLSDLKILIDVLAREMEYYRSELNHFLILTTLRSICIKPCWAKLEGHRLSDLVSLIEEIEKISPSSENQRVAHEVLTYIK